MIYIYKHRNIINGKIYIGQTNDIKERWKISAYKNSKSFYRAIQKYGWENFTHEILSEIEEQNEADNQEISLIEYFDSTNPEKGYNILPGGGINTRGMKFPMTDSHRKNISNGRKGIKFSDEHKLNISEAAKKRAKGVYLIDTIDGWDEYYINLHKLNDAYSEWNYNSLRAALTRNSLYMKRYKIEYDN